MKSFSESSPRTQKLARDLLVYAVTDRAWLGLPEDATEDQRQDALCEQVRRAIAGGTTFVQLREKHLDTANMTVAARKLQAICSAAGVPFVVNDDVQAALDSDADGVHVGQDDMAATDVRALLGPDKILGVSAQTVQQALDAQAAGADYLGVGAVFPTGSKDDAVEVPAEELAAICAAVDIPVVAIGGITRDNVPQLAESGIVGVSVISAIFAKQDIEAAARDLRQQTVAALMSQGDGAFDSF